MPDDPLEVIRRAIVICAREEPGATFEFDQVFFEGESQRRNTKG